MRPIIWPKEKKLWLPGRRALLTGLGALAAGGLLTRKQARAVTITSSSAPTPPFRRNLLRRNGGFEVWQRGAGGSAVIAGPVSTQTYTADGWYVSAPANEAMTVSQVPGLVNGSQWACKVQRNAGQTGVVAAALGFPLDTDEIFPVLGQFCRLSLVIKAGANWSGGVSGSMLVRCGTGNPAKAIFGYTGSSDAISLPFGTISTTATQYQGGSAAIVPINTRQMEAILFWAPTGTAGADDSFTIDDVKLEVVPDQFAQATEFDRYEFTEELLLCQRHFFKTFHYAIAPAQNAGTGIGEHQWMSGVGAAAPSSSQLRYPVQMRTGGTIIYYNPAAANAFARNVPLALDCTATGSLSGSPSGIAFNATTPAGNAAQQTLILHLSVDAGI